MLGLACVDFILALLMPSRICVSIELDNSKQPQFTVGSCLRALLQDFADFVVFCLKSLPTAWLTVRTGAKLTTSQGACRAPRATHSRSRRPVGVRASKDIGFAAALQATSGRSERR